MESFRPLAKGGPKFSEAEITDTASEIREWLDRLEDAGWTQVRVAVELGVSETSLYMWASGQTDPKTENYKRLKALSESVGKRRVG